jgi:hypothetical protein
VEAFTVAIRSNDGIVTADQNRCPLQLRYPADALIRIGDIAPAEVVDSDTRHTQSMAMLENVLQILSTEVAPRDAFSRVLREVEKSGIRKGGLLVNRNNRLSYYETTALIPTQPRRYSVVKALPIARQ